MNKTVLVIGVLALAGVGAYFYFKPKTTGATTGLGGLSGFGTSDSGATSTTPVPPTGTQLTTPQQVEEIAVKIATARDLTKRICELKKQYKITTDEMNDFMNFTSAPTNYGTSLGATMSTAQALHQQALLRKKAVQEVADSIKKLQELGYKENNCEMVKIA